MMNEKNGGAPRTATERLDQAILTSLDREEARSFGRVSDRVKDIMGTRPEMRVLDRALQRLRRTGHVFYRRSEGEKGSHGWLLVTVESDDV